MASNSKVIACLMVVCAVVAISSTPAVRAAVTCGQVVNSLSPCISYLASGGAVPSNCCNGVRTLYGMAQTTPDRQGVCKCIKQAISGVTYSSFNLNNAAGLPAKCGVNVPYKISPETNCDSVKV